MRVGLVIRLFGRIGDDGRPHPSWSMLRESALAAEDAGFDSLVFEDALMYQDQSGSYGVWESVAVAGAIAEATTSIDFGPSVFNGVYRNPAMLANVAVTLNEISEGRFIFGLGAGNTPDDYRAYGFPTDHRFSRFAEAVAIIHDMLEGGPATLSGAFWSVDGADLVFRRPDAAPRLVIAAGGPKMMKLAVEYADEWNWWSQPSDPDDRIAHKVTEIDSICQELGRDPSSLTRSVDLYSIDPSAGTDEMVTQLAAYRDLGFDEVRCALGVIEPDEQPGAVAGMSAVVDGAHALT